MHETVHLSEQSGAEVEHQRCNEKFGVSDMRMLAHEIEAKELPVSLPLCDVAGCTNPADVYLIHRIRGFVRTTIVKYSPGKVLDLEDDPLQKRCMMHGQPLWFWNKEHRRALDYFKGV